MSDSAGSTLFVDVILPLAIAGTYTYRVPEQYRSQILVGQRIVVPFGKSKVYSGIIQKIHTQAPQVYEAKYIQQLIDDHAIIQPWQLEFWEWLSSYYMSHLGDVMQVALPAALKLNSETRILLNREISIEYDELNDKEYLIVEALEIQPELSITDVVAILNQKSVLPYIKSLFDKRYIVVSEELEQRYKPKMQTFVQLQPFYQDKAAMQSLFEVLQRAPKQIDLLLAFQQLSRQGAVSKKDLLEKAAVSPGVLTALVEKEIFQLTEEEISRFGKYEGEIATYDLSPAQQAAYTDLEASYQQKGTALLHGITSSGKTLLYIRLIEQCLADGKQALYLLPEIALTTQIIQRLRKHFGDKIGVYHSKFNDNERAEIWKNVLNGTCRVILGARSAIFLPFKELGLILVDEEHEQSYKQQDPSPRYHARDAAIYLGAQLQVPVILGSATPAIETYFNAVQGKYKLVTLSERFGGVQVPLISTANVQEERKRKTIQAEHFTSQLMAKISDTLAQKEQIVLFQNRRGYAPSLSCKLCAHTPHCINCDVSLTYHKSGDKLQCHYCGYQQKSFELCPACGHDQIELKSFGTEKVEDELQQLLPTVRIARMDLDTTRAKHAAEEIINAFENRETDILVGTQMVAKGLDFTNLTLTAILNADSMLNFPDFRAYERSFQLLSQVAGRAGRREKQGQVIIQTHQPDHPIIQWVLQGDYKSFYTSEIQERQSFHYPPFYRLIELTLKHKDLTTINSAALQLAIALRADFGEAVLGPEFPAVSRIRNYYQKTILLKLPKSQALAASKKRIREHIQRLQKEKAYKAIIVQVDVDPY